MGGVKIIRTFPVYSVERMLFVGASLLAIASGQSGNLLTGSTLSSERRPQQAGSYEIGVSGPFLSGSDSR